MSLTDAKIRNLKPGKKPFKTADYDGLYVLTNPGGSKLWRFKYRINVKERLLSIGAYPAISLMEARALAKRSSHPQAVQASLRNCRYEVLQFPFLRSHPWGRWKGPVSKTRGTTGLGPKPRPHKCDYDDPALRKRASGSTKGNSEETTQEGLKGITKQRSAETHDHALR